MSPRRNKTVDKFVGFAVVCLAYILSPLGQVFLDSE